MAGKFRLKVNWLPRLIMLCSAFAFTYFIYVYVFNESFDHALFMSLVIGFSKVLFIQPGIDNYYLKKHFGEQDFVSTIYIRRYFMLFYSKLLIKDDKLILLNTKWNVKNHIIQFNLNEVESVKKVKLLGVLKGVSLKIKSGEKTTFWVSNSDKILEVIEDSKNTKLANL
ncbi:hypothetical protein [Flavobacteriaceae bacterium 14752]|uniref:hypothetical protein n=1 Tax=Mesohalobacter salilacus TaxID=2491711 RepID=UPI000F63B06F|nr:hypothetical protein EIG84_05605 [Flavobacteriaceae bacterium 14752]